MDCFEADGETLQNPQDTWLYRLARLTDVVRLPVSTKICGLERQLEYHRSRRNEHESIMGDLTGVRRNIDTTFIDKDSDMREAYNEMFPSAQHLVCTAATYERAKTAAAVAAAAGAAGAGP